MPVKSKEDLFDAYNVLFGSDNKMPIHVLRHLQPSVLNSAYRKKALESHPDRSKVVGENEAEMNERFIGITLAYEKLSSFMKDDRISVLADEIGIQRKGQERTARPNKKESFSDHFYKGFIPKRRLLIGQFILTWKTWSSGPGQRQRALPQSFAFRSNGVMEYWSIGKRISGFKVFQEPSLSNASIRDHAALPSLHYSISH